jgi:hypothetical protein
MEGLALVVFAPFFEDLGGLVGAAGSLFDVLQFQHNLSILGQEASRAHPFQNLGHVGVQSSGYRVASFAPVQTCALHATEKGQPKAFRSHSEDLRKAAPGFVLRSLQGAHQTPSPACGVCETQQISAHGVRGQFAVVESQIVVLMRLFQSPWMRPQARLA